MLLKNVQEIKTKDLRWINVTKCGKEEMEYIKKEFNLHHLDLKDCFPPIQRPKLVERTDYLFMILQFPVFNRDTKTLKGSELDFFISQNYVITVHSNELTPLMELFESCKKDESLREKYLSGNPATLLYEILNRLLLYCFPILNHISLNIDEIENKIFSGRQQEIVENILCVKRNIINFRRSMQAHKNVIKKLIAKAPRFFSIIRLDIYFKNLIEYTKEIWDDLENYKETIEALYNTNESLLSYRLNTIIKTLTIFSVIVLPLTLIASIFGMNVLEGMPFINNPSGFWILMIIMIVITVFMVFIFKKKKWL